MDESKNNSRRDFLLRSAALGASAVIVGPSDILAQKLSGAETSSRYGPYPADGMAGYSETGPLKPLKFQRRALGPKDVAIKIHFCGVCTLTSTLFMATGARSNIRRSWAMNLLEKS
jgi:uncharacterized zinc-type alcohol dehydrogenase-like protein